MDAALFAWVNGWAGRSPFLDGLVRVVGSDFLVPSIFSLLLVALWFEPDRASRRLALGIVLALLLANLLVAIVNTAYPRPRPFSVLPAEILMYRPSDPSFPSNAAAVAAVFPTMLWGRGSRLFWISGLLGLAFSLSRVVAGVHYPFDVLAGWIVGWLAARALQRAAPRIRPLLDRANTVSERVGLA